MEHVKELNSHQNNSSESILLKEMILRLEHLLGKGNAQEYDSEQDFSYPTGLKEVPTKTVYHTALSDYR